MRASIGPTVGLLVATAVILFVGLTWPPDPLADPSAVGYVSTVVSASIAAVAFSGSRHEMLDRRTGAAIAALGSLGVAVGGLVALLGGIDREGASVTVLGLTSLTIAVVEFLDVPPARVASWVQVSCYGLAIVLLGYVVAGLMSAVPVAVAELTGAAIPPALDVATQQVAIGVGFASVAIGFMLVSGRGRSYLDFDRPTRDHGLWVVIGLAAAVGVAITVELLLAVLGTDAARHTVADEGAAIGPSVVLLAMAVSIVAVTGEELLFRNGLQKLLSESFSPAVAIAGSSVVFAAGHLSAYSGGVDSSVLASLGLVFVLSVLIGYVYFRTQSLLVAIGIHWGYNLLVYLVIWLQLSG